MGVGNHDFDDGRSGLKPFLEEVGFPVLGANLDLSNFPEFDTLINNSVVLDINGTQVGIIGYITKDLNVYDSSNIANMTFSDEIHAVNKEAKRLKQNGVEIIIATGHSGKIYEFLYY